MHTNEPILINSLLCANCYPKRVPAVVVATYSYCEECYAPLRKNWDECAGHDAIPGITQRGKTQEDT